MISKRWPLSFHLSSAFTPRFTFQRLLTRCDKTASCWLLDRINESVRMLPCGLHSVISRLLALVSALCICCFLAHRLLYGTSFVQVIQCHHLFLHFPIAYELISWPPAVLVFVFVLVWVVCFFVFFACFFVFVFLVFVFCLARSHFNGVCIDPFQFSSVSHCHYDQSCYCINSVNLHNAIVFPVW